MPSRDLPPRGSDGKFTHGSRTAKVLMRLADGRALRERRPIDGSDPEPEQQDEPGQQQ